MKLSAYDFYRFKNNFTSMGSMVPAVVQKMKLGRQVEGALVCQRFRKVAEALWGPEVAQKVTPRSFAKGVLNVDVAHSGWAQEVQLKKVTIMKALREAGQGPEVTDLRLKVC